MASMDTLRSRLNVAGSRVGPAAAPVHSRWEMKTSAICLPPTGCWTLHSFQRIEKSSTIVTSTSTGAARKTSRLESPLGNGRHGFFIEAAAVQGPDDTDLRRASVACDDDFQHNRALNSVAERLARVLRLDFFDQARCGYCPARAVNATASSTAGSGAESGATSRAYTSPASSADAAPGPWTCRRA